MTETKECPFKLGEPCTKHACQLWHHIIGVDPQTGKEVDLWDCAFNFHTRLLIENSQQTRQVGSAIESYRNETVVGTGAMVAAIRDRTSLEEKKLERRSPDDARIIEETANE